ncbi:hypothetical protein ACQJBY_039418 [Aegilops geniculata]
MAMLVARCNVVTVMVLNLAATPLELRHLSYLQKEGIRPSSRLAAVSPIDSFVQQGGHPHFFTSRATRVIDTDYRCPVGVMLFNHSEVWTSP